MTTDAAFHAGRRNSLGASEWSQVIGISPFGCALDVYNKKLGLVDPSGRTSDAIERGNRQESFVLKEFEAKRGVEVRNEQLRCVHPEHSWASATLDGMAFRGLKQLGPVEAKTINTGLYGKIPDYYLIQVLVQCWVTGSPEGWLAVWSTKDMKLASYPVRFIDHIDFFRDAQEKCERFWFDNVIAQVPPPPPERREREERELPDDLLDQYCTIGEEIKRLADAREKIKREILDSLGNPKETHAVNGQFRVDITSVETSRFSAKKLESVHPDLVKEFQEKSVSQRVDIRRLGVQI
jgi:putative phage-type endonuclease